MKSETYRDRAQKRPACCCRRDPNAVLGVEFEREAAHVALGVRRAELARNGREARDHLRLGARREALRLGVSRNVARDGQRAIGAPAFGMDGALGDALAILMRELLDQLIVLQEDRPARAAVMEF